jgi:hypothetical protein
LAELAAELVRLHVDVIFTGGTNASRIVSDAVKETPLVIHCCDPFEHVAGLARPEGNLTGVTRTSTELSPKRLELLKEVVPNAVRVVFLSDPDDAPPGLKLTQDAAPRLGIKRERIPFQTPLGEKVQEELADSSTREHGCGSSDRCST